ncbi:MAG: hypothetical protein NT140_11560 [Deltaproteobacteria bacterium]|nr:hypothetical protein [Deltaproteobacteria bacterium]
MGVFLKQASYLPVPPAKYFTEVSSTNLWRSIHYGLGCLWTALKMGIISPDCFR